MRSVVSSATTVNSLVNSGSDDRHRLPLRGRSSLPGRGGGTAGSWTSLCLAWLHRMTLIKTKKQETVGTKVGHSSATCGRQESEKGCKRVKVAVRSWRPSGSLGGVSKSSIYVWMYLCTLQFKCLASPTLLLQTPLHKQFYGVIITGIDH